MTRPGRRSWPQRMVLSLNVVTIVAALVLAWSLRLGVEQVERLERVQLAGSLSEVAPLDGGARVLNILLVGSDSSVGLDPNDPVSVGRVGEQNSDVMIVAHLDERDGTAALLSLPRDLWVEIAGTGREAKLNAAFAIGGPAELIDTVELNFGIPINAYVHVDFAGFRGLVEAIGEVELYFDRPARDWNAQYDRTQTGFEQLRSGCVALGPDEALSYVRSRHYQTMSDDGVWVTDPTGDFGRIRRQQDFLKQLIREAIDQGARNPFVLNELIDSSLDSVIVDQDLTPKLLLDLGRTYSSFEPEELQTYSYPGVIDTEGSLSIVRGLDAEAEPVLELFRGARSDAPSTVLVRVKTDGERRSEGLQLADALVRLGFAPGTPQVVDAQPGIEIRYGPDGRGAAIVVLEALQSEQSLASLAAGPQHLVPVDGLRGREVIVTLGVEPTTSEEPALPDGAGSPDDTAPTSEVAQPGVTADEPGAADEVTDTSCR